MPSSDFPAPVPAPEDGRENPMDGTACRCGTLALVGVSHRRTPLELRERLAVPAEEVPAFLARLRDVDGVEEAVAVSTCNRSEVYLALGPSCEGALDLAARAFCDARGVAPEEVEPTIYRMRATRAVRHLFETACGLDSMVPGENEVFGQVKAAYASAVEAGAAGGELSRLFQRAFKVAKDVRSRTGISRRRTSVATVVVELAERVFGSLGSARVSLVGAGEMAELALKALSSAGARVALVANRSVGSARELVSRHGGEAVGLERVGDAAEGSDVLVASTSAPGFTVTAEHVRTAVSGRKGRPMLLADLGVPRDIDPAASDLEGVILYDVDDLQGVVAENMAYRLEEAARAKLLVSEEVRKFADLIGTDDMAETIAKLCEGLDLIGENEARRALGRMGELSDGQRRELDTMARRIVRKVLHSPINALKESARGSKGPEIREAVRRLFDL